MLNFTFGVVVGVALTSLGVLSLPKLKSFALALKTKFTKAPALPTVTTPPTVTPTVTP